jgi:hypothetical protein
LVFLVYDHIPFTIGHFACNILNFYLLLFILKYNLNWFKQK